MNFFIEKPLVKHIAAIHNCALLTSVQRRTINILLSNALNGPENEIMHFISFSKLKESLGWKEDSKTTDLLKEDLKALAKIQIEWNVLNVDKKNKWTAMQLLSEISIEGSTISYSYPPTLREMLFRPNVFAKLNLNVQISIKKRNALVLWEFLCGEFCLNKTDNIITRWFSYDEILKINGLENSIYKKRYSEFIQKILDPSLLELNEKSDIFVSCEKKMSGKKIESIRFIAKKKNDAGEYQKIIFDEEEELRARFEGLGFNKRIISSFLKDYTRDELENALDVYYQQIREGEVKYPVAFFKKALLEGWLIKKEKCENVVCSFDDIDELREDPWIKQTRKMLLDCFGADLYKSWFKNVIFEFDENENVVVLSPTLFHSDWIESKYSDAIKKILETSMSKKNVYFKVIKDKK
ncbi:MAG: hypothetical protein FADNKDHG_01492 [Holosporales bacterium]